MGMYMMTGGLEVDVGKGDGGHIIMNSEVSSSSISNTPLLVQTPDALDCSA